MYDKNNYTYDMIFDFTELLIKNEHKQKENIKEKPHDEEKPKNEEKQEINNNDKKSIDKGENNDKKLDNKNEQNISKDC